MHLHEPTERFGERQALKGCLGVEAEELGGHAVMLASCSSDWSRRPPMALLPRWRYMTDESKALVKRGVVSVLVLLVAVVVLRALLPWVSGADHLVPVVLGASSLISAACRSWRHGQSLGGVAMP